jgi:hypothetical protein
MYSNVFAQGVIVETTSGGPWGVSSYLKWWPATGSPNKMFHLGLNMPSREDKLVVFGGGINNAFSSNASLPSGYDLFKPYAKWQKQNLISLYPGPFPPANQAGYRYMANIHNWGTYQAYFGLKESQTNVNSFPEQGGGYLENNEKKNAVISMGFPIGLNSNQKPRLIFEAIQYDSLQNSGDIVTELATMDVNGNWGLGTSTPLAKLEINQTLPQSFLSIKSNSLSFLEVDASKKFLYGHNGVLPQFYSSSDFYVRGATRFDSDIDPANDGSSMSIFGGVNAGIFAKINNGNKMRWDLNNIEFKVSDINTDYLKFSGGKTVMSALKTTIPGNVAYLTIDDIGEISTNNSFPNPVLSWNYEGNTITTVNTSTGNPILGTINTNAPSALEIHHQGDYSGVIAQKAVSRQGLLSSVHPYNTLSWHGDLIAGGLPSIPYPTLSAEARINIQGRGDYDFMYTPPMPVTGDATRRDMFLQCKRLVSNLAGTTFTSEVRFQLFESGIMRLGSFYRTGGTTPPTYNNPYEYDGGLMIGKIGADPIVKYAIKVTEPDQENVTQFAIGYNNAKVFMGDATIMDPYANKFTFDGDVLPAVSNSYNLGNSANRWGQIWSQLGQVTSSDIRLKTNIIPVSDGVKEVLKLKPIIYNFKNNDDGMLHYGFSAQDLRKQFGNAIVYGQESDTSSLGVVYTEIIPLLTKAIQEQNEQIMALNEQIAILARAQPNTAEWKEGANTDLNKLPVLFQNTPNPFSGFTAIDFFIPKTAKQASIIVYSSNGVAVYSTEISKLGMGRIILNDDIIKDGTYFYTLYVDGKQIDTKKMMAIRN